LQAAKQKEAAFFAAYSLHDDAGSGTVLAVQGEDIRRF
jgi:hypothetical protein